MDGASGFKGRREVDRDGDLGRLDMVNIEVPTRLQCPQYRVPPTSRPA